jgi:hypothetical protein
VKAIGAVFMVIGLWLTAGVFTAVIFYGYEPPNYVRGMPWSSVDTMLAFGLAYTVSGAYLWRTVTPFAPR